MFDKTSRTKVRRIPDRGRYDEETVFSILDEAFVCHVGFAVEGKPFVIPTLYGRVGTTLYVHGSAASRMLREMERGVEVCVTVTLVDGLVLARSAFHHSMNYRSVVLFGTARLVEDPAEKLEALRAISEHIVPNRWDEVRGPNEKEMKATSVLAIPISEVSAKVRTGGPKDDDEDYAIPVWAGVLPLHTVPGEPIPDDCLPADTPIPAHVSEYSRS
jgi:uncharacterized protein